MGEKVAESTEAQNILRPRAIKLIPCTDVLYKTVDDLEQREKMGIFSPLGEFLTLQTLDTWKKASLSARKGATCQYFIRLI